MNRKFIYHTDPGHGWLEVNLFELEELGIRNRISSFSYRKRAIAMLEEDCDMVLFIEAYVNRFGCKPCIEEQYSDNSFVRDWPHYY
jgi:hypothetical protein